MGFISHYIKRFTVNTAKYFPRLCLGGTSKLKEKEMAFPSLPNIQAFSVCIKGAEAPIRTQAKKNFPPKSFSIKR